MSFTKHMRNTSFAERTNQSRRSKAHNRAHDHIDMRMLNHMPVGKNLLRLLMQKWRWPTKYVPRPARALWKRQTDMDGTVRLGFLPHFYNKWRGMWHRTLRYLPNIRWKRRFWMYRRRLRRRKTKGRRRSKFTVWRLKRRIPYRYRFRRLRNDYFWSKRHLRRSALFDAVDKADYSIRNQYKRRNSKYRRCVKFLRVSGLQVLLRLRRRNIMKRALAGTFVARIRARMRKRAIRRTVTV